MKKILLAFGILFLAGYAMAGGTVWRSSYTATADTTKNLCMNQRGFLHSVCISSGPVAGATVTVYNSSAAAVNPMAVLNATESGCYQYDVVASTINKGLTYSNSAATRVTILYDCY